MCDRPITGKCVPLKAIGFIKPDEFRARLVLMHAACESCERGLELLCADEDELKGWHRCGPSLQLGMYRHDDTIEIEHGGRRSTMKILFDRLPMTHSLPTSSKTSFSVEIDGDTYHFERLEPNPAPQRLQVSPEELERLRELAVEKQKEGAAPLPVVRLCFVGRGRAGKTTTLRRLKGEPFRDEEEPSTHGLDVWAGQAEAHLQADGSAAGPWKEWKESVHHTAVKDALRKAPEADVENPGTAYSRAAVHVKQKNDAAPLLPPETCGPTIIDDYTISNILSSKKSEKDGVEVRLQCWDFPGQEEYALLNQIFFSERAIYLVFFDMTGKMDEEWRHICFWLWAIGMFSKKKNAKPPILLLGTKAGEPRKLDEFELQKRLEDLQEKVPWLKEQLQLHPNGLRDRNCFWLFPIENKGISSEEFIRPLRRHLQHMALQFVTPRDSLEADDDAVSGLGVQAKLYPMAWLQAHDLLTRLGSGFRATAPMVEVKKVAPDAELKSGRKLEIASNLRVTLSDKSWLIVPRGSSIKIEGRAFVGAGGIPLNLHVSCDFLELEVVQQFLKSMQPTGLSNDDAETVLRLLNLLGTLVWMDQPELRNLVLLNPRRVAVAMASLMTICFGQENFEHRDMMMIERKITEHRSDLLRFQSTGIATRKLIRGLWKEEFPEESQQELIRQILLEKHLMFERLVQDEFVLPSCLPVAHSAEEVVREAGKVLYLDVGGLLSPNFFPALAQKMYSCQIKNEPESTWKPGPPQVFRNRGHFHAGTCSVSVSVFPVSLRRSSKSVLRIVVQGGNELKYEEVAQKVKHLLEKDIFGFNPGCETDPASFFQLKAVPKENDDFEGKIVSALCMTVGCQQTCSLCRLRALLEERFLPDLDSALRSVVQRAAIFGRHTRPAGSFRFKAMKYPGDVDLEEYLAIDANSRDEALTELCRTIQTQYGNITGAGGVEVFFGGFKAGFEPTSECSGAKKEYLSWTQQNILCSSTEDTEALKKALGEGHHTWTAKLDMFAKVKLFEDSEETPRYFEVTNVLRAGWFKGPQPIQPISDEKDFLQSVEKNLAKFSGEEPNAMKYVKRLWERSAYLAERGFDLEWNLSILEALRPLLGHWVAELNQVAAHVETIINMMQSSHELFEHACADLPILRQNLSRLKSRLHNIDESEKQAAEDGRDSIAKAMEYIPELLPESPPEAAKEKDMLRTLRKAQLLLESCVETVLIGKLGSFEVPLAKPLGKLWTFPSDHPPIAAMLKLCENSIKVASWNVLNRNYYKYIDKDTQGLKGSKITMQHEAGTRESKIIEKIEEMLQNDFRILCLQECWPELLQQLGEALEERQPEVQMRCSGEDKNQEAILFHSDHVYFRERIHFHRAFRENFKKVVTEAHFKHAGMGLLRVVTTHLPGAPFGRARKEFADCIAGIVKGEKLPTVLLADLNFPEKAIQPLLLDHDLDVSFVPTPYPTNICQGSLLPKRIDSIAVINHEVKGATLQATALKAEDVLDGLREVVDLLKSRSAEPWTPTRYQSDKDPSGRWSMNFTYTIGPEGNEGIFDGKVQLLDRHVYNSVSAAVNYLNDGLSVVPEGYCVVFSGSQQNYYLLWREDKKAEVFSLLGLSDQ